MLDYPLSVKRRLSDGRSETVGLLAENRSGCFFQYDNSYLEQHKSSLAPFNLRFDNQTQQAPLAPHYGLHGVFADSLPDGWGLYLMDRVFRENGYNPAKVTALERLAFIGERCLGALFYEPELDYDVAAVPELLDLLELGREAVQEFEGTESSLIEHLMDAGGSGGARPKLTVTLQPDGSYTTKMGAEGTPMLIKLTSEKFHLKHAESLVEYVYLRLAKRCGIEVPDFALFDAGKGRFWLQQKRFDCIANNGRLHMISAAGLLDASFRAPSLDYIDLVKATQVMCGPKEAQKMVQRALFNYLTVNQDDHSKNFAFLADDQDKWRLSPFYDIVYSPSPYGEHMSAFNGKGRYPDKQAMTLLAGQAGLSGAKDVWQMAAQIFEVVSTFSIEAEHLGIPKVLIKEIQQDINGRWQALSTTSHTALSNNA